MRASSGEEGELLAREGDRASPHCGLVGGDVDGEVADLDLVLTDHSGHGPAVADCDPHPASSSRTEKGFVR